MLPSTRLLLMVATPVFVGVACSNSDEANLEFDSRGNKSSGDGGTNGEDLANALPCDVQKVFADRCQLCHGPETKYGASVSLVTWSDLTRDAAPGGTNKKVYEIVAERIHNKDRPMPPVSNPPPTPAEIAILDGWIRDGAKPATTDCGPGTGAKPIPALSCKPTMELKAKTPFVMQPDAKLDQYQCFGVDVDRAKKQHIIGVGPKIDNANILHHILVFESKEAVDPNPHDCKSFQGGWKMITGWAPGAHPLELPPQAGFPQVEGVTHYAIQLHYNNAKNLPGQKDNSGIELCTTEELRPNDAAVLAFGSLKVDIPPRSTTTITCDYELDKRFKGVTFFSSSPHMHKRGQSLSTRRLVGGKAPEVDVFTQPKFDFENQGGTKIDVKVEPGDVFRTDCTYKNPDDLHVKFGENTDDEMCFNFLLYYPAIPDEKGLIGEPIGKRIPGGGFGWVTPSIEDCGFSISELMNLKNL